MTGPARYTVRISPAAASDLREIAFYLAVHRSTEMADAFATAVLERIEGLETFPLRGVVPAELEKSGRTVYRQVLFGRYRILYRLRGTQVTVVLIADGRRDMQALLRARLVGPLPHDADDA